MSKEKRYDVCLKSPEDTANGKQMTKAEFEKYLKELSETYGKIPQDSCLYSFFACFTAYDKMTVNLGEQWNRKNNSIKVSEGWINIGIYIKNCGKCHQSKCIKNIQNGKCVDDFVCNIIGIKLFPEQYEKQR